MATSFFSFLEGIESAVDQAAQGIEKEVNDMVQNMDAEVDLEDILERLAAGKGHDDTIASAFKQLDLLAYDHPPQVLYNWILEDKVLPVACAALCRIDASARAVHSVGSCIRVLNRLWDALDQTKTSDDEVAHFAEQIVGHTENGRALLKAIQVEDPQAQVGGLVLIRRVYPYRRAVLSKNLLSDPEAIHALVGILQSVESSSWAAGDTDAATLCCECVGLLRLVTEEDGDVRMIVTFQDGTETLLTIVAHALSAAGGGQLPMEIACSAARCVLQLCQHGPTAMRYMRETGHLVSIAKTLRIATNIQRNTVEAAQQLEGLIVLTLDIVDTFASGSGGDPDPEATTNCNTLIQSGQALQIFCLEAIPAAHIRTETKLRLTKTLSLVLHHCGEQALKIMAADPAGGTPYAPLPALVQLLLNPSTPLALQMTLDLLLEKIFARSHELQRNLGDLLCRGTDPSAVTFLDALNIPETEPEKPLLPGWESAFDPNSGRTYYLNRSTGVTQWEKPEDRTPKALQEPGFWFANHLLGHAFAWQ